ncbi:hypothetical protein ACC740_37220, partial [Rhizobium ruizarguesonis]
MSNAMRTPAGAINVERYQGAVADGRFRRLWNANAPGYLFLLPWRCARNSPFPPTAATGACR